MLITLIVLSVIAVVLLVALRNLMVKVERYEDITVDQTEYLQSISDLVKDSQKHLQNLDEKGTFQSDDEVGYFFEQMKNVQKARPVYAPG